VPLVLQYNKQDLPGVFSPEVLDEALNFRGVPAYAAAAVTGAGVFDTLRGISDLVLKSLSRKFRQEAEAGGAR
jgi:signal recognition particle receptor subunit beta